MSGIGPYFLTKIPNAKFERLRTMLCEPGRYFLEQFVLSRTQEHEIQIRTYLSTWIFGIGPCFPTKLSTGFERLIAMFREFGRSFLTQFRSGRAQEHKIWARTYFLASISRDGPYVSTEPNTELERLDVMFRKFGRLFLKKFLSGRAQECKIRVRTYFSASICGDGPYLSIEPNIKFKRLDPIFHNLKRSFLK